MKNQNAIAMIAIPTAQDLGDRLPAIGDKYEWRAELRYRRADIADTENTEGGPLFFGRVPPRNIGNTDGERPAGDTDKKRGNEELWNFAIIGIQIKRELNLNENSVRLAGRGRQFWATCSIQEIALGV